MSGFFSAKETQSDTITPGKTFSCVSCGLYKDARTPKMKPFGNFKKRILNIGIAPAVSDDIHGKPFQSKEGKLVKRMLARNGIDLYEDCLNINSVNCTTDKPTNFQINCCRSKVLSVIKQYKPHTILLFGFEPVISVIGNAYKDNLDTIAKWRGWSIPDRNLNAWVCPLNDPEHVFASEKFPEVQTIWNLDIVKALETIKKPLPVFEDEHKYIVYRETESDIEKTLIQILKDKPEITFFDYETTSLKPHRKGQRILCVSIAVAPNKCYAFPFPETDRVKQLFCNYLTDPDIGKAAANMKFEQAWSKVRAGLGERDVYPWLWDTMQAGHILDNRPNITGLKFQTYVNFGLPDYDSHIKPYMTSDEDKGANSFNKLPEFIKKYGMKSLLTYCGLDGIFEYRLGMHQMKPLNTTIEQLKKDFT